MSEVVKGRFTIDLGRAREKLGKYQLANPYAYVLEFVQAAVLRGAEEVEVTVDSDDLLLSFGGPPLLEEELHNLEMAVLEENSSLQHRVRKKLAMGLLAAQSLEPSRITMRGSTGYCWEQRFGRAVTVFPKRSPGRNLIHVKMPWTFDALLDRFRKRKESRPEEVLLKQHCRLTTTVVRLNGELLSQDPARALDLDGLAGVGIAEPGIRGWGGLMPGRVPEVTLVANGVVVESEPLALGEIPFCAVVECSSLTTDISGTSVHRDSEYDRVMAVVREARGRSLARLTPDEGQLYSEEIRNELFSLNNLSVEADTLTYPGCLMLHRLFRYSDGRPCSLLDLRELVGVWGFLPYTVETFLHESLERYPDILHAEYALQTTLRDLTGWSLKNMTRQLRQRAESRANERAWRFRPTLCRLTGGTYLKRASLARLEIIDGFLGIKSTPDRAHIRVVVEGCLLCEWSPPDWPLGLEACLQGEFTPSPTYDGVQHNEASVNVLLRLIQNMRELYEELAKEESPAVQPILSDFLRVAAKARPVEYLLSACGVPVDQFQHLLRGHEWPSLGEVEESPLLDVSWVKTEGQGAVSVRELRASEGKSSPLVVTERQKDTLESLLGYSLGKPEQESKERFAFRLDPTELREERFLAALRGELSRAGQGAELRLGGYNLSRLVLSSGPSDRLLTLSVFGGVQLHRSHPLIEEALQLENPDSTLLLLIVSVLFTAINRSTPQVSDELEAELQAAVAGCLLAAPAHLASQGSGEPAGCFDPISPEGICSGWVQDPAGLGLRLYFEEPEKGVEPSAVVPLSSPREQGGYHFSYRLPVSARDGGRVLVRACLVHPKQGNLVPLIGSPRAYAAPHKQPAKPIGRLLEVTTEGVLKGWCLDPNDPEGKPQVEIYLDGNWKEGEWIGYVRADQPDPLLEEETGFRGSHAFSFPLPGQCRDGIKHTLCAYGFDLEGESENPVLDNSPLEFVLPPSQNEGDEAWSLGREALERGDYDQAVEQLKVRLSRGGTEVPDDEVWSFLGSAYSATERLKEADDAFFQALKLAPWQSEHWYFSGLSRAKLGSHKTALNRFRKAVQLDSTNVDALWEVVTRTSDPVEAVAQWEKLLTLPGFKKHRQAYLALLKLHLQQGQTKDAMGILARAREAHCDGVAEMEEALRTGGRSLPAQGERKSAEEEEAALFESACQAVEQGRPEEGLRILKGIASRGRYAGSLDEFWFQVARANTRLGRYEASEKALGRALLYAPDSLDLLGELARVLELDGRSEKAREALERAGELEARSAPHRT